MRPSHRSGSRPGDCVKHSWRKFESHDVCRHCGGERRKAVRTTYHVEDVYDPQYNDIVAVDVPTSTDYLAVRLNGVEISLTNCPKI